LNNLAITKNKYQGKFMKILHIISGLSIGGAETMLFKLLSLTNRTLFNPLVISLTDEGKLGQNIKNLDITVYKMNMNTGIPNPVKVVRFIRLIRKVNPALIQGWMYHGNLAALLAKKLLPKRVSLLWNIRHTPDDLKKEKHLTEMMIRLGARLSYIPDGIIYNAGVSAQKHKELGYSDKQENIIPNGFNCEQFKPENGAHLQLCRSLNIEEDAFLVGLIARYHKMKDHESFLYSARELLKIYPKVNFVLAGSSIDKKNQKLVKQINDLKINKNVHLLGELRNMNEITAGLDIACSSSAWGEGFSNSIGEAMSCGVPCVVTDVGDSAWLVGKTGLSVKPGDRKALTNAMITLIKMKPEERQELGGLARQRIVEYFSLDTVVKKYEQLYLKHLSMTKH